jgi:hypothetical protein
MAAQIYIGFELASLDEVRALHAQMLAAGVVTRTDVFRHERGSRFFCEVPVGCSLRSTPARMPMRRIAARSSCDGVAADPELTMRRNPEDRRGAIPC